MEKIIRHGNNGEYTSDFAILRLLIPRSIIIDAGSMIYTNAIGRNKKYFFLLMSFAIFPNSYKQPNMMIANKAIKVY
jgi:hypothetical protein